LLRREPGLQEGIMSAAKHRSKDKARGTTRFLRKLGPGLITGASDDDPSGIGTYSQAGAQLGFGIGWTMLLTYPLMAAIQEISARLGRVTGHGIAGNICRHYPGWLLNSVVALLFVANTINIGADLGAMADGVKLLAGGHSAVYVMAFGAFCAVAEIFLDYHRYVVFLKWLTLALFAYVGALAFVAVPWGEALRGLLIPRIVWSNEFLTTLVALLGTTISPYLFFWQAAQEAEDERVQRDAKPLVKAPQQALKEFERIRLDTLIGMAFSNLIAIAIIITTAATLHEQGITTVQTSAQAAEALKPIAGPFASLIFTLGIVGTGLLAVPVLAGSAAYGIGEGRRWPVGLSRKPKRAKAFYAVIAIATALGVAMNFMPIDPIKALYWSAVINGVVAVPVMIVMMLMSAHREIMGRFVITGPLAWLGWLTTAAMAACVAGMAISWMT
jgi:NRAMP (natural resistance-associated macrophage protein)-like metal ion transporter